jgi:hypothetical protein
LDQMTAYDYSDPMYTTYSDSKYTTIPEESVPFVKTE